MTDKNLSIENNPHDLKTDRLTFRKVEPGYYVAGILINNHEVWFAFGPYGLLPRAFTSFKAARRAVLDAVEQKLQSDAAMEDWFSKFGNAAEIIGRVKDRGPAPIPRVQEILSDAILERKISIHFVQIEAAVNFFWCVDLTRTNGWLKFDPIPKDGENIAFSEEDAISKHEAMSSRAKSKLKPSEENSEDFSNNLNSFRKTGGNKDSIER